MIHLKKIRETVAGQIKDQDVRLTPMVSRFFFTNADVSTIKVETSKENS